MPFLSQPLHYKKNQKIICLKLEKCPKMANRFTCRSKCQFVSIYLLKEKNFIRFSGNLHRKRAIFSTVRARSLYQLANTNKDYSSLSLYNIPLTLEENQTYTPSSQYFFLQLEDRFNSMWVGTYRRSNKFTHSCSSKLLK